MKAFFLAVSLLSLFSLFAQNDSQKKSGIYSQLDQSYLPKNSFSEDKTLDINKEILRLESLLAEEQTKSAPDASHISKLTFHIQDLKIKRQNHNLK
jgi:hypothetical protein